MQPKIYNIRSLLPINWPETFSVRSVKVLYVVMNESQSLLAMQLRWCLVMSESLMLHLSILLICLLLGLAKVVNHALSKLFYIKERLSPPLQSYTGPQRMAAPIRQDEGTGLSACVCARSGGCDERGGWYNPS